MEYLFSFTPICVALPVSLALVIGSSWWVFRR
jgi:hypothetical protein